MTRFGYFLSSEEYEPASLIRQAKLAEQAGFDEVYLGQVGGREQGAFEFFGTQLLPRLRDG
jgi:hypothetical protein